MRRLVVLLVGLLAAGSATPLLAQTKYEKELAAYTLTLATLNKVVAATRAMSKEMLNDPKFQQLKKFDDQIASLEKEREALLKKASVEKATAEAQKTQMGSIELAFERKAGEGGTLFGSVTSMDIAEALQAKGYEIDRRSITLRDAIKETGDYTVKVKLHREVTLEVPVTVKAEGGEEVAAAEKKGRKKKEDTAVEEPATETAAE